MVIVYNTMIMKNLQLAANAIVKQKLITYHADDLCSFGVKHHEPVLVETPNGSISTTWEFGPIRFGKNRTAITQALHLKLGDKLLTEFIDNRHIKLTPLHYQPGKSAAKNYNSPAKNEAREKIWQTIAQALAVKPKNALVLYLPGREDFDREEALKLGFHHPSLIAVERDDAVFAELRHQKKIPVIHSDLTTVLNAWSSTPVHVIYADFSCGWCGGSASLLRPLVTNDAFSQCILAINLLRGRDQPQEGRTNRGLAVWDGFGKTLLDELKHRVNDEYALSLVTAAMKRNPVVFKTYRSSHQTFDTAIWRMVTVPSLLKDTAFVSKKMTPVPRIFDKKLRQDIAAVLAIRTMRLNKTI